jgi:hypothetical protein
LSKLILEGFGTKFLAFTANAEIFGTTPLQKDALDLDLENICLDKNHPDNSHLGDRQ